MDFIKQNLGLIIAGMGGLIVSFVTAEKHSPMIAIARFASGMFCCLVFTDPFVDYMGLAPDTYRNAVAGLFSMTGYAATRFINNLDRTAFLDMIRAWRGK